MSDTPNISPSFGPAPKSISVSLWVEFSGVSLAARALVKPLIAGAMTGDGTPAELDRGFLAWHLGKSRYDKGIQEALDELKKIGFLKLVDDDGVGKSGRRRKRRHPVTGHVLPDRYILFVDPPADYVGPRNIDEARAWYQLDREAALERHAREGKRSRAVAIPRARFGHLEDPQVSAVPGDEGVAVPPFRGTAAKPQLTAVPGNKGVAVPRNGGTAVKPQVSAVPRNGGTYEGGREGLPTGSPSLPRSNEGWTDAAPATAPPGAASASAQAMRLIAGLAWPPGRRPNRQQATELAVLVDCAVNEHDLTFAELAEHLAGKLRHARSNPVAYLRGALQPSELPVPTPDADVIPINGAEPQVPHWCGKCGRGGGEAPRLAPHLRLLEEVDEHGAPKKCSCHPDNARALASVRGVAGR